MKHSLHTSQGPLAPKPLPPHTLVLLHHGPPEELMRVGYEAGVKLKHRARERLAYRLGYGIGCALTALAFAAISELAWYIWVPLVLAVLLLDIVVCHRHDLPSTMPRGARFVRDPWWAFWRASHLELRVHVIDTDIADTSKETP